MNKIVEKALEINKLQLWIPVVELGDVVELNNVWDGEGETPIGSYSWLLTHDGEDGEGNFDIWINYEFDIVEEQEEIGTLVKITNIELI